MSKRIIVNADDFGLSEAVSTGILDCAQYGIVTSTSIMVVMAIDALILERAHTLPGTLGLGLHLTLAGKSCPPVLPPEEVPSLVRSDGNFYDEPDWSKRASTFDEGEVFNEIQAQYDRFVSLIGHSPDHLDSHYHATYRVPAALHAMLQLAGKMHLPIRNPGLSRYQFEESLQKAFGIAASPTLNAIYHEYGLPMMPTQLISVGAETTLAEFEIILATLPEEEVCEILCHPGYVDDQLRLVDSYTDGRVREVALLKHPDLPGLLRKYDVELCKFAVLSGN